MDEKIGRNDPCPCGSGKKYKKCCLGKQDEEYFENEDISDLKCFESDPDPIQHVEGYDVQKWEEISERMFGDKESFTNLMFNWAGMATSLFTKDEPLDFAFAHTGPFKIFLLRDDLGIIDEHQVGVAMTRDIDSQLSKKVSKR